MRSLLQMFLLVHLFFAAPSLVSLLNAEDKKAPEDKEKQLAEAKQLATSVLKLLSEGKARAATAPAKKALEIRQSLLGDEHHDTIVSLHNLGVVYKDQNNYAAARPYFDKALAINKKVWGDDHPETATSLNHLGSLLKAQGNFAAAKPLYEQALKIRRKELGDEHADTVVSLNNLGGLYQSLGDYAAAKPYYEQVLAIRQKVYGEEHRNTAHSLSNLGTLYQSQGDYAAARGYYEQALRIRQKVLGENHVDTAASFYNLAVLLRAQADYNVAKPYYEQALAIRLKVLGEDHRDTANSLAGLGLLLQAQGDYAGARPYMERALEIDKKILGKEHPSTAAALTLLGSLIQSQGDYAAAHPYFEEALRIRKKVLGEEHPDTASSLNYLGFLLKNEKKYTAARPYYEQALKIRKKALGEEHPETALSMSNLALLLVKQQEYDAARSYFEQSLAIRRKTLGEEHPLTAISLNNLGTLFKAQGNYVAAGQQFEQALKILNKVYGDNHHYTVIALDNLTTMEAATGNISKAMELQDQARRGNRRHIAQVLPSLTEKEQLLFLRKEAELGYNIALSVGTSQPNNLVLASHSAEWLLNGKAVAQAALTERNLLLRDSDKPELAGTIAKLLDTRRRLATLALLSPRKGEEQKRRDAIAKLTAEEATLTHRVAAASVRKEPMGDAWIDLASVRKAIPPESILIEIARFSVIDFQHEQKMTKGYHPPRYMAWLIPPVGKGDVEIVDLGAAKEVESALRKANKVLTDATKPDGIIRQQGEQVAAQQMQTELARIAELVWKPLFAKIPADAKRLILSPDGELWLLPWSALPIADDKYLLEKYSLQYEVSGRDLANASTLSSNPKPPVILADPDYDFDNNKSPKANQTTDPKRDSKDDKTRGVASQTALPKVARLPNTKQEAEAVTPKIQQTTGLAPQVHLGSSASEGEIKRVDRPRILVLSTHGFFLSDQKAESDDQGSDTSDVDHPAALLTVDGKPIENPLLRCGLLFAGCNARQSVAGNDGVLTGMEVTSLDLRGTELVVLSACETGLGQVNNGEGVAGLRQAFQLAGAQAVVATLWQVPDRDSALIMNEFFANLAAGQSHPDALRNAQLKRIEARRERHGAAHPFFWAAWTITGK